DCRRQPRAVQTAKGVADAALFNPKAVANAFKMQFPYRVLTLLKAIFETQPHSAIFEVVREERRIGIVSQGKEDRLRNNVARTPIEPEGGRQETRLTFGLDRYLEIRQVEHRDALDEQDWMI